MIKIIIRHSSRKHVPARWMSGFRQKRPSWWCVTFDGNIVPTCKNQELFHSSERFHWRIKLSSPCIYLDNLEFSKRIGCCKQRPTKHELIRPLLIWIKRSQNKIGKVELRLKTHQLVSRLLLCVSSKAVGCSCSSFRHLRPNRVPGTSERVRV